MSKSVTIAELIKASEKNGFPWSHSERGVPALYIDPETKKPRDSLSSYTILSCVVGQGVVNLDGTQFPGSNEDPADPLHKALISVYEYNDNEAESYEDAIKYMKKVLAPYRRRKVVI